LPGDEDKFHSELVIKTTGGIGKEIDVNPEIIGGYRADVDNMSNSPTRSVTHSSHGRTDPLNMSTSLSSSSTSPNQRDLLSSTGPSSPQQANPEDEKRSDGGDPDLQSGKEAMDAAELFQQNVMSHMDVQRGKLQPKSGLLYRGTLRNRYSQHIHGNGSGNHGDLSARSDSATQNREILSDNNNNNNTDTSTQSTTATTRLPMIPPLAISRASVAMAMSAPSTSHGHFNLDQPVEENKQITMQTDRSVLLLSFASFFCVFLSSFLPL
jgi:hypothetical protein